MRQAVLDATTELLAAEGLAGTRVADVAARAGVHETSVYRRWGTRENLILEAVLNRLDADVPFPDTGSTREDLITLFTALAAFLTAPTGRALARLALTMDDTAQAGAVQRQFWTSRLTRAAVVIQRGIDRGDLPPHTDLELLLEALGGPLHVRILQRGMPAERDYVSRLVDLVLAGARTVPPTRTDGSSR